MLSNIPSPAMTNSSPQNPAEVSLSPYQSLSLLLKQLRLSHMLSHWESIETQALQENWSYAQFLLTLCELEAQRRSDVRLKRALAEAQLPSGKSFSTFDFSHCPQFNAAPLMQLADDSSWVERAENCLIFGASGVGKTHLASALARRTVESGKRAKFFTAMALVQQLQHDKHHLQLQNRLSKLDRFDLLILDDLGYVKKSEAETSVLFELIAHRYERKSLLITANQPFSQWDSIFTDSMMTVAAVDRLVHHAVILDIKAKSYRQKTASQRFTASELT